MHGGAGRRRVLGRRVRFGFLVDVGVAGEARLTKSNGGVMSAEQGKRDCAQMLLSGTAAGVMGAAYVCAAAGISEGLLRIAVGLEAVEDLQADLERGLSLI